MTNQVKIYSPISCVTLIKDKNSPCCSQKQVAKFVDYFRKEKISTEHILRSNDLKLLKSHFFSQYQEVAAAGGVVVNEKNEILLIYRRGFWDLPKGKIEKGESKRECAIREVEEECGVKGLKILDKLQLDYNRLHITYHTYIYKGKETIKPSYWYIMSTKKQKLTPQTNEDIKEAKWVKIKDIPKYYPKSYPAIRDVLRSTILQLGQ